MKLHGPRRLIIGGAVATFVALLLALVHEVRDLERAPLDDAARRAAPGRFVRLADGLTHYGLTGPDSSRTVVLWSGASVPYYLWDPTRDALVTAGYRVLRFDYFGRGWSDRPDADYDLNMFDRQLAGLLDSLGVRIPVDLAGVSMGGVVAADFARRRPTRVRSLILIAPGFAMITLRADVMRPSAEEFGEINRRNVPLLLIWGRGDHTVPFVRSTEVRRAFPCAEFHVIDSARHIPQYERPEIVDALLLRLLRAH
ncbi:MAG: alpha/beta fold hydrolase [Gemmatimonadaceae bacterium]|nr:alpha/beta fold hydrolase [Gemmatimonadaceae bacterium]